MTQGGFFERKTASPTGLTIVIAMHAAALGALALIKGPEIIGRPPVIDLIDIPLPPEPPRDPPPKAEPETPLPPVMDRVRPLVETPIPRPPVADEPPTVPRFELNRPPPMPEIRRDPPPPPLPPRAPVRTVAEIDPRFAGALQPPYPPSELRAERTGTVRVRVTVGADGRVKSIEKISATSDAFWEATERHARSRWRFRPATVDGRPVESTKVMNLMFELRT